MGGLCNCGSHMPTFSRNCSRVFYYYYYYYHYYFHCFTVFSEGMLARNDICASEVAIETSTQLLFRSKISLSRLVSHSFNSTKTHNFKHSSNWWLFCCERPAATVRRSLPVCCLKDAADILFVSILHVENENADRRWLWQTLMADSGLILLFRQFVLGLFF